MADVSTPLADEAREIFVDLGYDVSDDGPEFRATRDWKEVRVTAVDGSVEAPEDGPLRCFVAWEHETADLVRSLDRDDPGYEWAIIGVDEDGGDYEVARAPRSH